ncbi:MAG: M48 family metalloprotease [Bacteroidota bacterium]
MSYLITKLQKHIHHKELLFFFVIKAKLLLLYFLLASCLVVGFIKYKYITPHTLAGCVLMPLIPCIIYFFQRWHLKKKARLINENHLPEIYLTVLKQSHLLGLKKIPKVYMVNEQSTCLTINSTLGKNSIVLPAFILDVLAEEDRGKEIVDFIIGHALGHVYLGHLTWWKKVLPSSFDFGSYHHTCEYNSDIVGYFLAPKESKRAVLTISSLGEVVYEVDVEAYLRHNKKSRFIPFLHKLFSSHPSPAERVHALDKLAKSLLAEPENPVKV